ncbi:MAG TPA: hypothetical protein VEY67_08265 [Candidatus Dormibacteraeota bacterium]|nr:hypothetical protein [Candidatus Dormibacteraeota bacterium]
MARLHLRLGSLELARAELEAFAGAGALDPDALLDLAEVRWRTGDLTGAGVAAQAYLGESGQDALALVIAAEAAAASGRPSEARRLATQALERSDLPIDRLFAGIPRSGIWPLSDEQAPAPVGELFAIPATRPVRQPAPPDGAARSGTSRADGRDASAHPATGPVDVAPASSGLWDAPEPAPLFTTPAHPAPEPAIELEAGRADLAAGRMATGAAHLAIALRLAPSLAPDILGATETVAGGWLVDPASAALDLVRGDAYRLLGREVEARRSYAAAAATLEQGVRRP